MSSTLPIPGGVTRHFIDMIAGEYGIDSAVYSARVLGEFPDQAQDALCRRSWLEEAAERWDQEAETAPVALARMVVAIDPSRLGSDESVMAIRRGDVLTEIVAWGRLDTMVLVGHVVQQIGARGIRPEPTTTRGSWRGPSAEHEPTILVDEIGLGGPILDRLREQGYPARGFNGARSPRDRRRFLNRRSEVFWHLRRLLEDRKIALPRDERLWDELTTIQWKPNSEGKLQLEPKDQLRQRLGRSPDRADAVAMAFSTGTYRRSVPPRSFSGRYLGF
jgi:phage terminase large subunit-like protein